MKIGLLTFQRAYNYGTVFQAYALERIIRELGQNDVYIIDYNCKSINDIYKPYHIDRRSSNFFKATLKMILSYRIKEFRANAFEAFIGKYLRLTETVDEVSIKKFNKEFDLFIVGSDQIWNDSLTNNDPIFYLDFVNENRKKIAYSASFGYTKLPSERFETVSGYINKFEYISVRERSAGEIVYQMTGKKPITTLDPTLLLNREIWKQLAGNSSYKLKNKYILIYTVQPPVDLIKFAFDLKKATGLEIIYINDQLKRISGINYKRSVSPEEFLNLFINSEYILTNSFHGTVFSVIFNKKFFVEINCRTQINIRAKELLANLDLLERTNLDLNLLANDIDWNKVDRLIKEYKSDSINYLHQVLSR